MAQLLRHCYSTCMSGYALRSRFTCSVRFPSLEAIEALLICGTFFAYMLHRWPVAAYRNAAMVMLKWIIAHSDVVAEVALCQRLDMAVRVRLPGGYPRFGPIGKNIMLFVTSACARRTGAAACVEHRRREC